MGNRAPGGHQRTASTASLHELPGLFAVRASLGGSRAIESLLCTHSSATAPAPAAAAASADTISTVKTARYGGVEAAFAAASASPPLPLLPSPPASSTPPISTTSDHFISRPVVIKVHAKAGNVSLAAHTSALEDVCERLAAQPHPALCNYEVRYLLR